MKYVKGVLLRTFLWIIVNATFATLLELLNVQNSLISLDVNHHRHHIEKYLLIIWMVFLLINYLILYHRVQS